MKAPNLPTANTNVLLIEPNVQRDAALGLKWINGELGKNTLSLMGVSDTNNHATTLEVEEKRILGFIENDDQLNWMIEHNGAVVGAIWVDLEPSETVPAPAVHIMIGDPAARGQGIGTASTAAVIDYLKNKGEQRIYSRTLTRNNIASSLLAENGFKPYGPPYKDSDELEWQNAMLLTNG
jgi:RimJ/RimL family protein N-acetyltransferase